MILTLTLFPLLIFFLLISLLWQILVINGQIDRIRTGIFIRTVPDYVARYYSLNAVDTLNVERLPLHFLILLFIHEDDRFLAHSGFNIPEIFQSIKDLILLGKIRGGSSITQQVAKNLFTTGRKSPGRKFREMIAAILLERKLRKEQILQLYLSSTKFCFPIVGFENMFDFLGMGSISDISIAQSEFVISLIPAPTLTVKNLLANGVSAYDFKYSYEKLLAFSKLMTVFPELLNQRGFTQFENVILTCLDRFHAKHLHLPEIKNENDCITQTTLELYKIKDVAERLVNRLPSHVSAPSYLSRWQYAFCCLTNTSNQSVDRTFLLGLTKEQQQRVVEIARHNKMLGLLSVDKIRRYELGDLQRAVETEGERIEKSNRSAVDILNKLRVEMVNFPHLLDSRQFLPFESNFSNQRSIEHVSFYISQHSLSELPQLLAQALNAQSSAQWSQISSTIKQLSFPSLTISFNSLDDSKFSALYQHGEKRSITGHEVLHFKVPQPKDMLSEGVPCPFLLDAENFLVIHDMITLCQQLPEEELDAVLKDEETPSSCPVLTALFMEAFFYERRLPITTQERFNKKIYYSTKFSQLLSRIFDSPAELDVR